MKSEVTYDMRTCAELMDKAMRKVVKSRGFSSQHKLIYGRYEDIFSGKPIPSIFGRRYDTSDYFSTFSFENNKLWVRLSMFDMEKYPKGAYIDFNSKEPVIYIQSQYNRNHYQPVPIPEKEFLYLAERVKDVVRIQELYGCKGFMFRMNYKRLVMFVVFDHNGNPYHIMT